MRRTGLTLMEMLVVLVILGMVLMLSQTMLRGFFQTTHQLQDDAWMRNQLDFVLTEIREEISSSEGLAGNSIPKHQLILLVREVADTEKEKKNLKTDIKIAQVHEVIYQRHYQSTVHEERFVRRSSANGQSIGLTTQIGFGGQMMVKAFDRNGRLTDDPQVADIVEVTLRGQVGQKIIERRRQMKLPERRA